MCLVFIKNSNSTFDLLCYVLGLKIGGLPTLTLLMPKGTQILSSVAEKMANPEAATEKPGSPELSILKGNSGELHVTVPQWLTISEERKEKTMEKSSVSLSLKTYVVVPPKDDNNIEERDKSTEAEPAVSTECKPSFLWYRYSIFCRFLQAEA
jgi:hypothetical protein